MVRPSPKKNTGPEHLNRRETVTAKQHGQKWPRPRPLGGLTHGRTPVDAAPPSTIYMVDAASMRSWRSWRDRLAPPVISSRNRPGNVSPRQGRLTKGEAALLTKGEQLSKRGGASSSRRDVAPSAGVNGGAAKYEGYQKRHGIAEFLKQRRKVDAAANVKALRDLLASGVDIDSQIRVHWRPFRTSLLFECTSDGEAHLVAELLEHGPRLEQRHGEADLTPLYSAAFNGHAECVRLLCDAGADVGALTAEGTSPLYAAAQHGHVRCVEAL